jgi:tRNA(Leu) C34 or U34 (ribose-2'-O)-methylase TrmL
MKSITNRQWWPWLGSRVAGAVIEIGFVIESASFGRAGRDYARALKSGNREDIERFLESGVMTLPHLARSSQQTMARMLVQMRRVLVIPKNEDR